MNSYVRYVVAAHTRKLFFASWNWLKFCSLLNVAKHFSHSSFTVCSADYSSNLCRTYINRVHFADDAICQFLIELKGFFLPVCCQYFDTAQNLASSVPNFYSARIILVQPTLLITRHRCWNVQVWQCEIKQTQLVAEQI